MTGLRAAAAALLLAGAAAAQDAPSGSAVPDADAQVLEVRARLVSDPAFAAAVARRVANSRLIGALSADADEDRRIAAARGWIAADPDAAAAIALGLAADDSRGDSAYEENLLRQVGQVVEHNPGAQRNIFNRLRRVAHDSKLLRRQSEEMSEDERSEIMRTLFEGQGVQSEKVLTMKEDGRAPSRAPARESASVAFSGYYDRLGTGNLRGYSPQLLAMQSALNRRRPPGAPPLIETGKLDHATLSYPAYGMEYDVRNLEERLRRERALAAARAAGLRPSAAELADPAYEARLSTAAIPSAQAAALARRSALTARAREALRAFLAAAARSKDPARIDRALLAELGRLQKEAARWIAAAALEEDLARLDELAGFPDAALRAMIDAVPAPAATRELYRRRGDGLKERVRSARANAERALALLVSPAWSASLAEAERLIGENQALKRDLFLDVETYVRLPYRVAEALERRPRWREALDDLAVRWLPRLEYSREAARRRARLSRRLAAFDNAASGNLAAARAEMLDPSAR